MLKLCIVGKDLPANRKYWAVRKYLEMSYWNYLLTYFKNSMASVVIPMHNRVRDKNAILLSDGFLPKSKVNWSDFIPSWWSEERRGGLGEETVLGKRKELSELLHWPCHPFPLLLGWRYSPTSHTPKLATDGRSGGDCLALVPFFKCSCDSQHLSPHMGLQRLASRIWKANTVESCLFKFLGRLFFLI